MKRAASLYIGLIAVFFASSPLPADDTIHTVKKGDTLWDITRTYLETPWKWPLVWANNQDITNPHLIYPNDRVVISRKDGRTIITIIPAGKEQPSSEPVVYTPPEMAREEEKSIVISPRYSTFIFSPEVLVGSGTVSKKLEPGELASKNETVFFSSGSEFALDQDVTVVAKIADIKNLNKKIAGYLYKAIAVARVHEAGEGFYKATVLYSNQEIRSGDLIFDGLHNMMPLSLKISEPPAGKSGRVIDFYGGVSGSSYLDLVFMDLGTADGIDQGMLMSLYEESTPSKNAGAMREYQGTALVLQSLEKSSMALIMDSRGPIRKSYLVAGAQ